MMEMRRPETIGELMQFLQAANEMRLSLLNMAEVRLSGTSRTNFIAPCRVIVGDDWTPELAAAWEASRELLVKTVELNGGGGKAAC